MSPGVPALAALFAGGLLLRALAAAFEAALVAVGLPRAEELAAAPGAGRRHRALLALAAEGERTAAVIRAIETAALLAAGGAAAALGAASVRGGPGAAWAAAGFLVGGAALALVLGAAARAAGAAHGEAVALALALPMRWLRAALAPLARVLAALPVSGRPGQHALPRPPLEEMERCIAEYARKAGTPSDQSTSELIAAVFEFRDKVARDVMVPRTDVVAIEADTPVPEIIRLLAEEGHSRMPVYRGNLDQVLGVLHARDLVPLLAHPELIVLADLLRPAHFVPWSKPVDLLLREMQRKRLHMAVVVDEYGGVMGICTIEDVLEEIVGEIRDEFEEEGRTVETHPDGTFTVRGSATIGDLNRATGAGVPEDQGFETVAGFLNHLAGAIPAAGDRFFWRGWMFSVVEADPRRATRIRVARVKRQATG